MSYALSLLVLTNPPNLAAAVWSPDVVLDLATDYRIIGQLCDLSAYAEEREDIPSSPTIETYPLPPRTRVAVSREDRRAAVRTDEWGEPLRYTFSVNLRSLQIPRDAWWTNGCIKAFLSKMPPEIPVVLYPH